MTGDRDLLAAEYVLGTLDAEQRARVASALANDSALRDAVAAWEHRLLPMTEAAQALAPPKVLWDRIEASLPPAERAVTIRADAGEWITIMPGVEKKILHVESPSGVESFLLRVAPGATVPAHPHPQDEVCLVMSGEFVIGSLHLKAGDYHHAFAGAPHPACYSPTGATLYIRGAL
jgi:anti-sigma factor ChrR (cupin superfamily)